MINLNLIFVCQGWITPTFGEQLCSALIPFVALIEALLFTVAGCFELHSSPKKKHKCRYKDSSCLADESPCNQFSPHVLNKTCFFCTLFSENGDSYLPKNFSFSE